MTNDEGQINVSCRFNFRSVVFAVRIQLPIFAIYSYSDFNVNSLRLGLTPVGAASFRGWKAALTRSRC